MRVFNIRRGLATNSSSSHSLIYRPETRDNYCCFGMGFGWEAFTAASESMKTMYMAAMLASALRSGADKVCRDLLGIELPASDEHGWRDDCYVDHQSVICFPRLWDGTGVDMEFLKAWRDWMLTDGLVVLGGNDNDGQHPMANGGHFHVPWASYVGDMVARHDGQYWTIFHRYSGDKIRFAFDRGFPSPQKSTVPELVDVKITDCCPFGCAYCYQDSTPQGRHSDLALLQSIAAEFGKHHVFEVALGGGEPTLHPQFVEILRAFREAGVVPNFTTRNLAWLADPTQRAAILETAGAFAYSTNSSDDVTRFAARVNNAGVALHRANLHYVLGLGGREDFTLYLDAARRNRLRVTLLGFKATGRGAEYRPIGYDWWLDVVEELQQRYQCPPLSIDTALAKHFQAELLRRGINRVYWHTQEGAFSCYVDAVAKTISASSYDSTEQRMPFDTDTWLQSYAAIQPI